MDDKEKVLLEDDTVFILQPGLTIYVKTADVCSMLGVSNQWVGQLTTQGTLNKMQTGHGKLFNLTDSIRSYMDLQNDKIKKTAEAPNVAEDHQSKNAHALSDKGAAVYVADQEARQLLVEQAVALVASQETIQQLETEVKKLALPHSADIIADEVLKLAGLKA